MHEFLIFLAHKLLSFCQRQGSIIDAAAVIAEVKGNGTVVDRDGAPIVEYPPAVAGI